MKTNSPNSMKPMRNILLIIMTLTTWQLVGKNGERTTPNFKKDWNTTTKEYIKSELHAVKMPFYPEYNAKIGRRIKSHLIHGGKTLEMMLGRADYYFPIFEFYLKKEGLPRELKYLSMVESGLFPDIESPVGAAGLWQFMPQTARFYKLEMNEWVDERRDPYKSTQAAVKMLSQLYKQFKDWELVLAAYNCGPGRVQKAIKAVGSKEYDRIKYHLPKQTQEYLIKYVATTFVCEKYRVLGIQPHQNNIKHKETSVMKVFDWISFSGVSEACEVPLNTIETLNPSYLKGIIPKSFVGNYFVLPQKASLSFEDYLQSLGIDQPEYVFGEPERIEEPQMQYWVAASVMPAYEQKVLEWNFQGWVAWSKRWGQSLMNTLKLSNFLSL